jgi:S1-C subfamily serine protease
MEEAIRMSDERRWDDEERRYAENATSGDQPKQSDAQTSGSKIPYYYSYGPFRSGPGGELTRDYASAANSGATREPASPLNVEPLRINDGQQSVQIYTEPRQPKYEWVYPNRKKKKSRFMSNMAAFLAGALVVGGLMFAADKANLFTGDTVSGIEASPVATEQRANAADGDGGSGGSVSKVALDSSNDVEIERPMSISAMVKVASPAVVKIETYVARSTRTFSGFDFFFTPRMQQEDTGELRPGGEGSGFFFDAEGYILTNEHVIDGAKRILVQVEGYAEKFEAELIGSNADLDLAVLKIEGKEPFPTLPLGDSDKMEVGDWVVAIGNPYGFDHTVTVGVLSAKEREIPIPDSSTGQTTIYKNLLQTDASINPGNSGGPLLNLNGEVIGINTAVSTQAQGIGFAIPTSVINSVLDNLKNNVPIPKPYIGVYMRNLSEAGLQELGLKNGVVIASIIEGSPAEEAQLQPYDVIVEVEGTAIENTKQLAELIAGKNVGDRITMRVWRDGKMLTVGLTIGDQNAN